MNKPKTALVIPNGATVEESRQLRQQQQQARFRNRGGTFVPSETNPILDLLMARSVTGESPTKSRRPRASVGKSTLTRGPRKSTGLARAASVAPKSRKAKPKDTPSNDEQADAGRSEEPNAPAKPKRQAKGKSKAAKPKSKARTTAPKKKTPATSRSSREKTQDSTQDEDEDNHVEDVSPIPIVEPIKARTEKAKTKPKAKEVKPKAKKRAAVTKAPPLDDADAETDLVHEDVKDAPKGKARRKQVECEKLPSHEASSDQLRSGKRKPASSSQAAAIDTERLPRTVNDSEPESTAATRKRRKVDAPPKSEPSAAPPPPPDSQPPKQAGREEAGKRKRNARRDPSPPEDKPPARSRKPAAPSSTGGSEPSTRKSKRRKPDSPPSGKKPSSSARITEEDNDNDWEGFAPQGCDQTMTIGPPTKRGRKPRSNPDPTMPPPKKKKSGKMEELLEQEDCDDSMTIGPGSSEAIRAAFHRGGSSKSVKPNSTSNESAKEKLKAHSRKPAESSGSGGSLKRQALPEAVIARLKKSAALQHVCDEEPDPLDFLS